MLIENGKLNGVMTPTTPTGSRTTVTPPRPVGDTTGAARSLDPRHIVFDELAVVVGRFDGAANLNQVRDESGRADLGDD